jgi:hypothetical protein
VSSGRTRHSSARCAPAMRPHRGIRSRGCGAHGGLCSLPNSDAGPAFDSLSGGTAKRRRQWGPPQVGSINKHRSTSNPTSDRGRRQSGRCLIPAKGFASGGMRIADYPYLLTLWSAGPLSDGWDARRGGRQRFLCRSRRWTDASETLRRLCAIN